MEAMTPQELSATDSELAGMPCQNPATSPAQGQLPAAPGTPSTGLPKAGPGSTGPGAPMNNSNAGRHYLRSTGWPSGCDRERRMCASLGRALRAELLESGRVLNVVSASLI